MDGPWPHDVQCPARFTSVKLVPFLVRVLILEREFVEGWTLG